MNPLFLPPVWIQLIRYLDQVPTDLPELTYITSSGGKVPESVLKLIPGVVPGVEAYLMYGLTEAFRSRYLPPELFEKKMGSVG